MGELQVTPRDKVPLDAAAALAVSEGRLALQRMFSVPIKPSAKSVYMPRWAAGWCEADRVGEFAFVADEMERWWDAEAKDQAKRIAQAMEFEERNQVEEGDKMTCEDAASDALRREEDALRRSAERSRELWRRVGILRSDASALAEERSAWERAAIERSLMSREDESSALMRRIQRIADRHPREAVHGTCSDEWSTP
jgi:hypothetical protein